MKYGVILADPPWSYSNGGNGAAKNHYQTMTDGDLLRLPIGDLAAEDAVLLLWATFPRLDFAMQLISSWGFVYKTGFPWIKISSINWSFDGSAEITPQYGTGFWVRGCAEPILIATKGKVSPPENNYVGLLGPSTRHSKKPQDIYEYAESIEGPYLELFAREKRPGWDVFGNEVEGSITLPGEV